MSGHFNHPDTFEAGNDYLWLPRSLNGKKPPIEPVIFLAYCACPAFVIVHNREGKKQRLPREELFEMVTVIEK